MAVMGVVAAVGESRLGRLPAVAERVLVGGQLVEQVVVNVDHADPGRGLGVDHADDTVSEIDMSAAHSSPMRRPPRMRVATIARRSGTGRGTGR
ncbi:MAG TPA: hypothetical protein VGH67_19900 [Solirubrobacteraceae bacterium]